MDPPLSVHRFAIAFFPLPLLLASLSLQQTSFPGLVFTQCLRNATESLPATFSGSLDSTLSNFTSLSAQGTTYAAASSDSVYAMFQCRGDLSTQSCANCMQDATARLPGACPLAVGALLRLDGCFLRYDNQSFFVLNYTPLFGGCNEVSTDDAVLLTQISDAMDSVISRAPKSPKLFALVRQSGLYAMAECWRYLNESSCAECLKAYPYRSVCNATVGERVSLASCGYRFEIYDFLEDIHSPPPSPPPSSPPARAFGPPPISSSPSPGKIIWIIPLSILGVAIIAFGALCKLFLWSYFEKRIKGGGQEDNQASFKQKLLSKPNEFSLKELEEATCHFNHSNKLGEGAFGIVYKGRLASGCEVAVKKLKSQMMHGTLEFVNEVNVITSVYHKNLIKLLGYCVEGDERILVYEYFPNGSVDSFLFKHGIALTWSRRFNLIQGMAKGLQYLHEESQLRIIHRDIKPNNILLDDQLNAIIADFGNARLMQDDETQVHTGVAGTRGYMAPEYAMHGVLTEKADVYSFGMVTLELVTGAQNMPGNVLRWAWQKWQHGNGLELADNKIRDGLAAEEVARVVQVALLCTQQDPRRRPRMSEVTQWLSGVSAVLETPTKPAYINDSDASVPAPNLHSADRLSRDSGGVLSVSDVEPR